MGFNKSILAIVWFSTSVSFAVSTKTIEHLKKRCFVWTPTDKCITRHKEDDERLVKKLTSKLTPAEATDKVIAEGKDAAAHYNDPITALYRYNQALILDPGRAEAWQGAADCFVKLDMNAEAVPLAKKAIELDPKRGDAYVALARAQFHLRSAEAKANYQKGLVLGALADQELARAFSIK